MPTVCPSVPLDNYRRPDFLVISPPKTGSTWLADNLRCHPELFVPAIKEVRYFSSLFKWLSFEWYCNHFAPAGDRRAGEASPSYASLPLVAIRHIHQLLPNLKLVFLMRDPVARAWSHARHNRLYGEADFADLPQETAVTDDQWRANFAHDWPLVNGDYLGQLRRWSSVFPAEQLFVGFYESIAPQPSQLLRAVFRFLGADPDVDLSHFPVRERILAGPLGHLSPALEADLRGLLRGRTEELVAFLRTRFSLEVPPEWQRTLTGPGALPGATPEPFRAPGADYPSAVLHLEATFATAYREIELGYRGYDIVFYRGALYGVPDAHGPVCPARLAELAQPGSAPGALLTAASVPELKERITTELLTRTDRRLQTAETELRATREALAQVAAEVTRLAAVAARPSLARRAVHLARTSARIIRARMFLG